MSLKLFPYKLGSVTGKKLARALRILRVRPSYNAKRKDVIVNWGNSMPPHFRWMEQDLNKPHAIALACNKLTTFETLDDKGFQHIPQFTTDYEDAKILIDLGDTIYCRTLLNSNSGRGIVIANTKRELVRAPLYTIKTKHKHEYRVHVFKGKVLDVQQKKKKFNLSLHQKTSHGIRNHSSGWVFARADVSPPSELLDICVDAINLLGLDFGAIDIGHRVRDNKFFLFEVNTAPGLDGTTLDKYVNAIYNYYKETV